SAHARTPSRSRSATVSCAASARERYEMPTSAPARASSSAVARPTPREPPVTTARLPFRSIGSIAATPACGSVLAPRLRGEPALDDLADRVADGEVELLRVSGAVRRHDQRAVHQLAQRAAAA